jgi:acyl-CoA synthetase (AMP-forming)/AMP-acid ligase II
MTAGPPSEFRGPPAVTEEGIGSLTLSGLLVEVGDRYADREAIAFHDGNGLVTRWSYRDLERQARAAARALLAAGSGKGTRVALLMGNRPEWVAAAYGVALAGAILVPLNTYLAPPELDYVLRHSDAGVLLMQDRLSSHDYVDVLRELCPEVAASAPGALRSSRFPHLRRVVCRGWQHGSGAMESWDGFVAGGDEVDDTLVDAVADEISPADSALVVYTSGTTARPKGIIHAHRGPALQSWRFARQLRLDPSVRVWSSFPLFWSAGFVMVMGATLAAGGCLVLQEYFEPGQALRLLEAERVTSPHAWAHQLAELEDHPDWPRADFSSLRQVEAFTSFGRHPSVHVDDVWSPRAAYGLSETCTIISSLPSDTPPEIRLCSQGKILPGNVVRILDPGTGAPQPAGVTGEIAVKGPTLMQGYVKALPEECFDADGFFRTGDAGYCDADGSLHWTGRTSAMIKTGGANVSPIEIEEALLHHPALKAAVAVGVPDDLLGQRVVLCAVAHEGGHVDEEDVRSFLRDRLASYKIPRHVLFFADGELSLTGNAKIRSEELRRLAIARLARATRRE